MNNHLNDHLSAGGHLRTSPSLQPMSMFHCHVHVSAAAAAVENEALMNDRYRSLVAEQHQLAGVGGGMNAYMLQAQQEMIHRQELERLMLAAGSHPLTAAAALPINNELELLNRRKDELIRLRNTHNHIMEAELVARACNQHASAEEMELFILLQEQRHREKELQEMAAARRQLHLLNQSQANQMNAIETAPLSANERDRYREAAEAAYRRELQLAASSNGISAERALHEKALAEEFELRQSMQRRLAEEEALAEQQKQQALFTMRAHQQAALLQKAGLESVNEMRRQQMQQQELYRLMLLQQVPDDELILMASQLNSGLRNAGGELVLCIIWYRYCCVLPAVSASSSSCTLNSNTSYASCSILSNSQQEEQSTPISNGSPRATASTTPASRGSSSCSQLRQSLQRRRYTRKQHHLQVPQRCFMPSARNDTSIDADLSRRTG